MHSPCYTGYSNPAYNSTDAHLPYKTTSDECQQQAKSTSAVRVDAKADFRLINIQHEQHTSTKHDG